MKKLFKEYIAENRELLYKSFHNARNNILVVFIYYILFLGICFGLIYISRLLLLQWQAPLQGVDPSVLVQGTAEQIESASLIIRNLIIFGIILAVFFTVFMIINWSYFQGLIYKRLMGRKLDLKYLGRFSFVNLIWIVVWFLIINLVFFGSRQNLSEIGSILLILMFIYLTNILYTQFAFNGKYADIGTTFKLGYIKGSFLLIPFVLFYGTYIVLTVLYRLVPFIDQSVNVAVFVFYIFLIIMAVCFYQIYTVEVYRSFEKEKVLKKKGKKK